MSLHEILRDKECAGNVQCFILAFVITIGGLCAMIYGIAWLETREKISADVYGAKHLEGRIKKLEDIVWQVAAETEKNKVDLMLHKHQFGTGKIKQTDTKSKIIPAPSKP